MSEDDTREPPQLPESLVCRDCWRYKCGLCSDPDSSETCNQDVYENTDGDEYYARRKLP